MSCWRNVSSYSEALIVSSKSLHALALEIVCVAVMSKHGAAKQPKKHTLITYVVTAGLMPVETEQVSVAEWLANPTAV